MIICITGIDGSGKTVQAQGLVQRLNAAGFPAAYVWTGGRAYLSRPLIWLAKRLLKAPRLGKRHAANSEAKPTTPSEDYRSYLASTRKLFKHRWLRTIWRHISLIEHSAEIVVVTLPHLLRGRIVVCDRYIYDSLLGIAVLAGTQPQDAMKALRLPLVYRALPMPRQWFFLDLPALVAFARRTDVVDVEFLERRVPLYQTLATMLQATRLDGTESIEAIEQQIWQHVVGVLPPQAATTVGESADS